MEYKIGVRNHWWFDAGIVGLYFIGDQVRREEGYNNISLSFDEDSLSIYGENEDKIREFLEHCYEVLASMYWNVSTKSQRDKLELVMYDEETGEFSLAPKRQATPVVKLFVKGTSWKAEHILYGDMDEVLKGKVDNYLKEKDRKLWGGKADKLLLTLPESQTRINILPDKKSKSRTICSICGEPSNSLSNISQTSFLFFASQNASRSFHSQGKKVAKICWECEFISKFAMDTVNYKKDGENLNILILNSPNLEHNINNQNKIGCSSVLRSIDKDNFFKNIGLDDKGLIKKARMPYELLWAYFVDSYSILSSNMPITQDEDDVFSQFLKDITYAPLDIVVISINDKGDTFLTQEIIFYNDISYVYRLINYLLEKDVDIKEIYSFLYEVDNKGNPLPSRNNVFRKVLNKHCILSDIESITFRKVFNNKFNSAFINTSNMLKFLIEYYLIIKGDIMDREQIKVAVNLGKQIVIQAYEAGGRDDNALKRVRGDLFSLRKTRTVTDFITQINTLQFRYGISVSNQILEGILNEVEFEDFKGYCIMGALNTYNNYLFRKKDKGENKDE